MNKLTEAINKYYDKYDITVPDFDATAVYFWHNKTCSGLRELLKEFYAKGSALGYQAGYEAARDEWWTQQDKEVSSLIRDTGDGK